MTLFLLSLFAPCLAFGGGLDGNSGKATQQMGLLWENFWGLGHFGALRVEVEFLSQACTTKRSLRQLRRNLSHKIARGEEKLLQSDVLSGEKRGVPNFFVFLVTLANQRQDPNNLYINSYTKLIV